MEIDARTQAMLLLTGHFMSPSRETSDPLTPQEWGSFAEWLSRNGFTPESLLGNDSETVRKRLSESEPSWERLSSLISRSGALALAMEKWMRIGLWVINRSDAAYPNRLKQNLKRLAPPIFFGTGNRDILNKSAITVVTARNATQNDITTASQIGNEAASQGICLICLPDHDVEDAAMRGAVAKQGYAIGLVPACLFKEALSSKYRDELMKGRLALISPFYPEAAFSKQKRVAVDKYRYCLAEAAIVMGDVQASSAEWESASENLERGWTPVWINSDSSSFSDTSKLVRKGARLLPGKLGNLQLRSLFRQAENYNLFPVMA